MAAPVSAINHAAENDYLSGEGAATLAKDGDGHPTSSRHSDNFHNNSSANGRAEGPVEESLSQRREGRDGISEPRLSSTLIPNTQVKSALIEGDNGGAHQTPVSGPQASTSTSIAESSRPAEKRKRSKHSSVKLSSDEALSEASSECSGMVLKFGSNTEEISRRTDSFSPFIRTDR